MYVAAQGLDALALVEMQQFGELAIDIGVTGSAESNKEDAKFQPASKTVLALAGQQGHSSRPLCASQWKQELSAWFDGGKPGRKRIGSAGTQDNSVGGFEWSAGSVSMDDCDLRPRRQRNARPFRNGLLNFDGRDSSLRASDFSQDCGVIPGAATEMKYVIASLNAKLIEKRGPETWLPVVYAPGFVESYQHIVIDIPRISVFSGPEFPLAQHAPGTGPHKALARHGCEGVKEGWRRHAGGESQILGVVTPRGLDGTFHRLLRQPEEFKWLNSSG